jgi:hypothetical protein
LYRLGEGLSGGIDNGLAQGLTLLDRAAADPTALITTVAVVGIVCAAGLWLMGTLFGRARAPARPPSGPPTPAPTVVVQAARPRRSPKRPRRRARRKAPHPLLRWLGVR